MGRSIFSARPLSQTRLRTAKMGMVLLPRVGMFNATSSVASRCARSVETPTMIMLILIVMMTEPQTMIMLIWIMMMMTERPRSQPTTHTTPSRITHTTFTKKLDSGHCLA